MLRSAQVGLVCAAIGLVGCAEPDPLGSDATAAQLFDACEADDLDACSRAAHLRSNQYAIAVAVN